MASQDIVSFYVEYVLDASGRRAALVAETDLELDAVELGFDKERVEALCAYLEQHRKDNPYLVAVRLTRRQRTASSSIAVTGTFGRYLLRGREDLSK
jgi:hypothetical protein